MSANMSLPKELESLQRASLESGIKVDEGIELFASILATDAPQVVITPFTQEAIPHMEVRSSRSMPLPRPLAKQEAKESAAAGELADVSRDEIKASLESSLAAIWAQVLGVKELKSNDNFFQLGGHSLMALQIVAAVRQRFPIRLDLSDIFEQPELGALAALVQSRLVECVNEMPQEEVRQRLASG